ncbi:hypothetical protein [Oryzobacter telluris]|uniref:hypothetical protein n=1 Tax=Oryzobacter telluris TaxID=3149179 RepID=UPI00370D42A6
MSDVPRLLLVVDGANVVGSRPDGWWRDRPAAAARLHALVVRAELGFDEVVLVLEGKARPGVPEGLEGIVRTVHAPGHGDDEIVAQVVRGLDRGAEVTVVTADRGLVERVTAVRASTLGPTWLLDH